MLRQIESHLSRVAIKGFKSIKECEVDLGNINVLIGANGSGKSNFIQIFEMLYNILKKDLAYYAGKKGISSLLYNGKGVTGSIKAEFYFGDSKYSFEVEYTDSDRLFFRDESYSVAGKVFLNESGHRESNALCTLSQMTDDVKIPNIILEPNWFIYHFHDTSSSSRIKSEHNIINNIAFINDARNLAAYLYRLKQIYSKEYDEILRAVRFVAPFFDDFVLKGNEYNDEHITLRWLKKGCTDILYASQFSDGTLRFICLATLLLQPIELQPSTIIIDEPEIGLHPFAIELLAEMIQKAAVNKQIIIATQSVELLNYFDVDDVVIVDYENDVTKIKRLDKNKLKYWLDNDYSLGELWNKNILGGRFSR